MILCWDPSQMIKCHPKNPKKGGVVQVCLLFGADTIDIVWHAYLLSSWQEYALWALLKFQDLALET